jgi:hypothetical protein
MISAVINPVRPKPQVVGMLADTVVEVDTDVVIEVDEVHLVTKFLHLLLVYSTLESQASDMKSCSITVPLTTCSMIVLTFTTTSRTTITVISQWKRDGPITCEVAHK